MTACYLCEDYFVICRRCEKSGTACNCGKRFKAKPCPLCTDFVQDEEPRVMQCPTPPRVPGRFDITFQQPYMVSPRAAFFFGFLLVVGWFFYRMI